MKDHLLTFAVLILSGAVLTAGTPVSLEIAARSGWRKSAENHFAIQRTASSQGTSSLEFKTPLKPDTFYVIEWESRGTLIDNDGQGQAILKLEKTVFPGFEVGKEWNFHRNYFYSGKATTGTFTIYLRKPGEQNLEIRNLKVLELSPDDYRNGFLFEFEDDNTLPGFWTRSWRQKKFAAAIVQSDFINGEKSMKLSSDGSTEASITSGVFPVIAGARYRVSFWARGSANGSLLFVFNSNNQRLSGNHPPINLLRKHCAIETVWKEYSFDVTYPTDLGKYPTAAIPMANFVLTSKIPSVLLDHFKVERIRN